MRRIEKGITRAQFVRVSALTALGPLVSLSASSAAQNLEFDMRSNFWENLHHLLYFQAQAYDYINRGNKLDAQKYVWDALAADALAEFEALPKTGRAVWQRCLQAYIKSGVTKQDLLSDSLAAVDASLTQLTTGGKPLPSSGIEDGLVDALVAAAPIYRESLWPDHDRVNRAWIAMVSPQVTRYSPTLTERLATWYQATWPLGPFRVDVSSFANWAGFYTNVDPIHTIASPRTLRNNSTMAIVPNQGATALEMIFHEASHTVVTPGYGKIGEGIENAATRLGVPEPNGLWHAVIFYTAGRAVSDTILRAEGKQYTMIADSVNVYTYGWKRYRDALVRHWQPYLSGERSLDNSLSALVAACSLHN